MILLLHGTSLTLTCVIGGYDDEHREEILEYRDGDGWRQVGSMKNGRYDHAISLVEYDNFMKLCEN